LADAAVAEFRLFARSAIRQNFTGGGLDAD
jgi:hypothetical protein